MSHSALHVSNLTHFNLQEYGILGNPAIVNMIIKSMAGGFYLGHERHNTNWDLLKIRSIPDLFLRISRMVI